MKCETQNTSHIILQETPRDFRTEVPNIIFELLQSKDIPPSALILYSTYRRIAGESGACWVGTRGLAEKCQLSIPTITKLKKLLSKPFKKLGGKSLIQITPGNPKLEEADTVTIIDIWPENYAYFKNKLTCAKVRHGGVQKEDTTLCKKKPHKKEPLKKEPFKNPPPLVPQSEEYVPKKESLRSEEEELVKEYKILDETTLSPSEKKRVCRKYTEPEVERAVKIAKHQPVKKTYMGLLLNILSNPDQWEDPGKKIQHKPKECEIDLDKNRELAKTYNEKLKQAKDKIIQVKSYGNNKIFTVDLTRVANGSEKTLLEKNYTHVIIDGYLSTASLESPNFEQDIKAAIAQLR